jgi:hypothetical protein
LLALVGTGCWTDACVERNDTCRERLSGIFLTNWGSEEPLQWCTIGDEHPVTTCEELGYTVHCDWYWVRPGASSGGTCP